MIMFQQPAKKKHETTEHIQTNQPEEGGNKNPLAL